jgi:hypothetical protein
MEALVDHQAMVVQYTPAIGKTILGDLTLFLASSFPRLQENLGPPIYTKNRPQILDPQRHHQRLQIAYSFLKVSDILSTGI